MLSNGISLDFTLHILISRYQIKSNWRQRISSSFWCSSWAPYWLKDAPHETHPYFSSQVSHYVCIFFFSFASNVWGCSLEGSTAFLSHSTKCGKHHWCEGALLNLHDPGVIGCFFVFHGLHTIVTSNFSSGIGYDSATGIVCAFKLVYLSK